jgi:hypothetical protein
MQVKNIARPVRAYRVRLDGTSRHIASYKPRLRRLLPTAAAGLIRQE